MSKNLTIGTPWKVITVFAIPLLIGNVVQQMYQVVDAMVVGRHLGVNALAAVGTTGAMMFLLLGFAWGMTNGLAIPTAQAYGAGDTEAVRRSVAAGVILTALVAIVITTVGVVFARQILVLLKTPEELLAGATTFSTISFAGAGTTMFFNYLSAIIRARGDSRTPLVFLVIASTINIGLVILFVQVLEWGIGGAAGATVGAQLISVILCFAYVRSAIPEFAVRRRDWLESRWVFGMHLRIGIPMGFQASIIAIGSLAVQVRLNTLGTNAVAAYTTAVRVDGLSSAFLASLGLAVSTFVAQNYGAQKTSRILVGVRQGIAMSVGVALFMALVLITFGQDIVAMFVGRGNSEIVDMAHLFLVVNGIFYVLLACLFVTRGALQGLGRVLVPTLSGILELVMRVSTAVLLAGILGYPGIVWASPLAWVAAITMLVPAWLRARKSLAATGAELERQRQTLDEEARLDGEAVRGGESRLDSEIARGAEARLDGEAVRDDTRAPSEQCHCACGG